MKNLNKILTKSLILLLILYAVSYSEVMTITPQQINSLGVHASNINIEDAQEATPEGIIVPKKR